MPTYFIQFPLAECHFLVDLDLSETTPLQLRYSQDTVHWETVLKETISGCWQVRYGIIIPRTALCIAAITHYIHDIHIRENRLCVSACATENFNY